VRASFLAKLNVEVIEKLGVGPAGGWLQRMVRSGSLLLVVVKTMPLAVSALLEYEAPTLTVVDRTVPLRMADANGGSRHFGAFNLFLEKGLPNLINLAPQLRHLRHGYVCVASQYQSVWTFREVHRDHADDLDVAARGKCHILRRASRAAYSDRGKQYVRETTHRPNEKEISHGTVSWQTR
jgi:hypothetical protein